VRRRLQQVSLGWRVAVAYVVALAVFLAVEEAHLAAVKCPPNCHHFGEYFGMGFAAVVVIYGAIGLGIGTLIWRAGRWIASKRSGAHRRSG
jgi:hypothetical protein